MIKRHPNYVHVATAGTYGIGNYRDESLADQVNRTRSEIADDFDSLRDILSAVFNSAENAMQDCEAYYAINLA